MKVFIEDAKCIGCGSCVSVTNGEIFDFNDEGKAYAKMEDITEGNVQLVKNAMKYCPTDAILEKNDKEDTNVEGKDSNIVEVETNIEPESSK